MKTIHVNISEREYPIYIGENILADYALWQQHIHSQQVMLVTNETIAPLYIKTIRDAFADNSYQYDELILNDGEQFKTIPEWQRILDALASKHHHRDTTLIALGGGVIGDMVGFAAACYQRGVNFLQMPTSLLAQVDASIGGKTAVNHPAGKNLIGAFHQPKAVIIDINTLQTLPKREFSAGIAEIIKAALIKDHDFFSWLEKHMLELLEQQNELLIDAIGKACSIKRDIVVADETEQHQRALLNLGHTFGHAIEKELGYGYWLHGEAVGLGLLLAAHLSKQHLSLDTGSVQRIHALLIKAKLYDNLPKSLKYAKLLSAMKMDKKVKAQHMRLILLQRIGEAIIVDDISAKNLQAFLHVMDDAN